MLHCYLSKVYAFHAKGVKQNAKQFNGTVHSALSLRPLNYFLCALCEKLCTRL